MEELQRGVVPEADPPFHWYLLEPDLDRFGQVCEVPIEMIRSDYRKRMLSLLLAQAPVHAAELADLEAAEEQLYWSRRYTNN